MKCAKHTETEADGMCVYCGKPYCKDCLVEVDGKLYCKNDLTKVFNEAKSANVTAQPNIIINNANTNVNKNIAGGKIRRKYSLIFDIIMICITGGLWIIWMILRPKYY